MRAPGEGTILKRTMRRPNGTTYTRYQARVELPRGPNGARQRHRGPLRKTQTEARHDLKRLQHQQTTNQLGHATPLRDYLHWWLTKKHHEIKPRTAQTYESTIRLHINPHIGKTRLTDLTPVLLQQHLQRLKRATTQTNTRKTRAVLNAALNDAVKLELLHRNPVQATPPQTAPKPNLEAWEPHHAHAYLQAATPERLHPLFLLILAAGLRAGEALGLEWRHHRTYPDGLPYLRIEQQLVTVGAPRLAPTKTSTIRDVPLGRDAHQALQAWRQQTRNHPRPPNWPALVFPSHAGTPLRLENVRRVHNRIIQRANVPRVRIHDLRHYHASRLIALGVDVATVSARLGHSRNSTTLDIYVRASQQNQRAAALDVATLTAPHPEK